MEVQVELTGVTGLVMHNSRLADPLDPVTRELKALTGKTKKTEAEERELAEVEWRGSLYWDSDLGAYIPNANLIRSFYDAATAWKLGEAVYRSLNPLMEPGVPLQHEGPKTIAGLFAKSEYVWRTTVKLNGRTRVARTRPIFRRWSLVVAFEMDENELSIKNLTRIVERTGRLVGLGDARKIGYGRFTATVRAA